METGIENLTSLEHEIRLGLIQNQQVINDLKSINHSSIAFLSELFLEELLNVVYLNKGWHFRNLNFEQSNYPAIDLADMEHRVCFQVTVTNSAKGINDKIKDTLTSFLSRGMDKDFDQLFNIIASGLNSNEKIRIRKELPVNGQTFQIPDSLFCRQNLLDLSNLYDVIFSDLGNSNLEKIKNILYKIPHRPKKEDFQFKPKYAYIKRTITNNQGETLHLSETLGKENRLTLLGVGGLGKTTELNFIADTISKNPNNFCFKVRLINYSTSFKLLLDARCKNWRNVPSGFSSFYLLDGFDEVDSNKMREVANDIKNFACDYPDFKILVSCRTNFNPFEIVNTDNLQKEKDQFCTCYLQEISESDIHEFIQNECNNPDFFRTEIIQNNFFDVFKNPFYLSNAIEIFNSSQLIPKNKIDFFQKLFDQRIQFEKGKDKIVGANINEYELEEGLKTLALTMQFAGTYKISNKDFHSVIREDKTKETIKRLFFNRDGEEWFFEHNNFQEFLAARKLSEHDWSVIKKIILLNNGKLKPKWLNTFSFLVNLVRGDSELIKYFIRNDIDSLVKVEPHKVDRSIRNEIFVKIIDRHKKEESIIWRNVYSENDLFNFGELETNGELVTFLLDEIRPYNSTTEVISNTISILAPLKQPDKFINEIKQLYFELLKRENIHKYGISRIIIESFSKWKIFDFQTRDELLDNPNLFINDAPLGALCHYLADANYADIKAELVHKFIDAFQEQRVLGSEYALLGVIKLLSHEELTKLILLEVPDSNQSRQRIWLNDLYKFLNERAIETYYNGSRIDYAIIKLVYATFRYHDEELGYHFKDFFEKTGLVESSFKSCFLNDLEKEKKHRSELFIAPALIADQQCLDWVISQYSDGKVSDEYVWNFLSALIIIRNQEGKDYFERQINEVSGNRFQYDTPVWESLKKSKDELWLKVLLDQKSALKCISEALEVIGKEYFTRHEVIELQHSRKERNTNIGLIVGLEFISRYSEDDIERNEIIQRFSDIEFWENLITQEHYQYLNFRSVPIENLKWIEEWCNNGIQKVVIKGALTSLGGNEYSYLTESIYFIRFALYLDLKLEECMLIEMTSLIGFDAFLTNNNGISKQLKLYDYLKDHLPINLLKNQILQNLQDGGLVNFILEEHIRVAEKEKWIEALPYLPKYINDKKIPKYSKLRILNFYQSHQGNSDSLVPAFESLDFQKDNDHFDWTFIDFMVQKKNNYVVKFLKDLINKEGVSLFKLGLYLIRAEEIDGFRILIECFNKEDYHTDGDLLRETILNFDIKAIDPQFLSDFLIRFTETYISFNLGSSGFRNFIPTVFEKLFELVSKTSIDEFQLISNINKLLGQFAKNETQKNIRYYFNEFVDKVNQFKDHSFEISDAIRALKEMGI
ncbi:MAG: SMEK domain-containing protein [Prolixibacteraceae bacterium]|nr:SMEK domain-containing protein [Prolixibacteraceae bacterium]